MNSLRDRVEPSYMCLKNENANQAPDFQDGRKSYCMADSSLKLILK